MGILSSLGRAATGGARIRNAQINRSRELEALDNQERRLALQEALNRKELEEIDKPYNPNQDPAILRERQLRREGLDVYRPDPPQRFEPPYNPETDPEIIGRRYMIENGLLSDPTAPGGANTNPGPAARAREIAAPEDAAEDLYEQVQRKLEAGLSPQEIQLWAARNDQPYRALGPQRRAEIINRALNARRSTSGATNATVW